MNGVAVGTSSLAPAPPSSGSYIGSDAAIGFINADIDDVRFYNRALTVPELLALAGYHPMQVTGWSSNPTASILKFYLAPEASTYGPGACAAGANCVSAWNDASGNGFDVAQATAARQPLYTANAMGSRPAIKFSDPDQTYLTGACRPALNSATSSFFAVFRETGNFANNNGLFQNGGESDGKLLYLIDNPSRTPSLFDLGSNTNNIRANLLFNGANETVLMSLNFNGSGSMYKNGTFVNSTAGASAGYNCNSGTLDIGRYYFTAPPGARHFDGLLGDFLYFDSMLTNASVYGAYTDREIVECFLSSKYGISLGHSCP